MGFFFASNLLFFFMGEPELAVIILVCRISVLQVGPKNEGGSPGRDAQGPSRHGPSHDKGTQEGAFV